ncbi:MAG: hypothetical protein KKA42_00415, partial [candidate division Zixibacteria bacterium]|nr:hypothetical protein [candidate division Zixibacteria bacterium]
DKTLAHAFEPYYTGKTDGTGLGLVICQRIVNDHNGSIELTNRQQGGAAVEIRLPQD